MPVHVSMNTRKMTNAFVQPRLVNICAFPKAYMQRISNISSNKKNTQKIYDEMSISFSPVYDILQDILIISASVVPHSHLPCHLEDAPRWIKFHLVQAALPRIHTLSHGLTDFIA